MAVVVEGVAVTAVEDMKKVKANRVCEDCGEIMFRRGIDVDYGQTLEGWSCPKCHTTR